MVYSIDFSEHALKDLRDYSQADQIFILNKIETELQINPLPRGNTIKKLVGKKRSIFRLRINASQSYRAFYGIDKDVILLYRIVPKKDSDVVIRNL